MRALVCAATSTEARACTTGVEAARSAARPFEILLTGVGRARAARRLGQRLGRKPLPELVISAGLAGGLAGVDVGTWITATRVAEWRDGECVELAGVDLRRAPAPAIDCDVVSCDRVLHSRTGWTPAPGRAAVVDMESAALARVAAEHGAPFMVLRLVSDTPARPLPPFLAALALAMASTEPWARAAHAARGVRRALTDPVGVVRVVRDGRVWAASLKAGWKHFADTIIH